MFRVNSFFSFFHQFSCFLNSFCLWLFPFRTKLLLSILWGLFPSALFLPAKLVFALFQMNSRRPPRAEHWFVSENGMRACENVFPGDVCQQFLADAQPAIRVLGLAQPTMTCSLYNHWSGWKTSAPNLTNGLIRIGPAKAANGSRAAFQKSLLSLRSKTILLRCFFYLLSFLSHLPAKLVRSDSACFPLPQVNEQLPGKSNNGLLAPAAVCFGIEQHLLPFLNQPILSLES